MKNMIKIFLLISVLALLAGCSSPKDSVPVSESKYKINFPVSGSSSAKIELKTNYPEFPDKMTVYKTQQQEITEDDAKAWGSKFGITGEISKDKDGLRYYIYNADTTAILEVSIHTGALIYFYKGGTNKLFASDPDLPSDEEAVEIAEKFLKERGLLPENIQVSKVIVGGYVGSTPSHLAVSFDYRIDGNPVTGPGDNYNVRIGDGGEVAQMMVNPIKGEAFDMVETKPVEQAFEELKEGKNYQASINTRSIEINDISTAYYITLMDVAQDYIVPVYVFKGQCFDADGNQLKDQFTEYIEALK